MTSFAETELILTPENRVYHLNLKNEDIADNVVLVGDQNRVAEISNYFERIDFKTSHREFITHTGLFKGKRITVISTGIGTDNIDIVLNELDAAVNINPVTRELNPVLRVLNIYRLGTSGALQESLPVNALVASSHGIGLDGLLNFYADLEKVNENKISEAFIKHTSWQKNLPYPYCVAASEILLNKFNKASVFKGITATAPGFYGPQGREIRLKTSMPDLNNLLNTFTYEIAVFSERKHRSSHTAIPYDLKKAIITSYENLQITNFEMETSALYGLGKLLGHNCLTICVVIANRMRREFTKDYSKSIEHLIENCLHKIAE